MLPLQENLHANLIFLDTGNSYHALRSYLEMGFTSSAPLWVTLVCYTLLCVTDTDPTPHCCFFPPTCFTYVCVYL